MTKVYTPEGSLQLNHQPIWQDDTVIPEKYYKNPQSRLIKKREKEREKASFERKFQLTGLKESTCPTHGVLPINRFGVLVRKGRAYVDKQCIKCKSAKRRKISTKRRSTDHNMKERQKEAVKFLADWYIDRLLVCSGIKKDQITPEMRARKRMDLEEKRERIKNPGEVKYKTKKSRRGRMKLSKWYIDSIIRNRKSYKGEEITEKMREKVRNEIYNKRQSDDKRFRGVKQRLQQET